jgi:hypothetical protein
MVYGALAIDPFERRRQSAELIRFASFEGSGLRLHLRRSRFD